LNEAVKASAKKGKTKKNETTITIFFNKLFLYYCRLNEFKIQGGGGWG